MGYRIVTLDNIPENIGHRWSHASVNCSTTNAEGVVQAAVEHRVDGVCTFASDVAVPSVGRVVDQLGLPGVSQDVARTMSHKHEFRSFLAANGFRTPRFVFGSQWTEIETALTSLRFPVIVKPVDSSGSRGVSRIDEESSQAVRAGFEEAHTYSRSGLVCIEEFISGIEVGGDGLLVDGRFHFIAVTHKHMDGFIVKGHSFPTDIDSHQERIVENEVLACCRRIGCVNGPVNFDVIVNGESATLVEMSPRNGGNGIPQLVEAGFGFDLEGATLRLAVGDPLPEWTEPKSPIPVGSLVYGSRRGGRLSRILPVEELKSRVPEVFFHHSLYEVGDEVPAFGHNGALIGVVLFSIPSGSTYDACVTTIEKMLNIEVEEKDALRS